MSRQHGDGSSGCSTASGAGLFAGKFERSLKASPGPAAGSGASMRYRMYTMNQTEQQLVGTEAELIEALSTRGWYLQERVVREARERRERRFDQVRQARLSNRPRPV